MNHIPSPMVCLSLPRVLLASLAAAAASAPALGSAAPVSALPSTSLAVSSTDGTRTSIRLPRNPTISADGQRIAFAWQDDVWTASVDGGEATRLTIHPGEDGSPMFSPDGTLVYFSSDRSGRKQIHVCPADGGPATQVTFDSASKTLHDITADGGHLLISQSTDRGWHYSEAGRAFLVDVTGKTPKRMLFDAGVRDAAISPDQTKVLFCRGRSNWNRKGYQGPQAMQLWLADLSTEPVTLTRLDSDRERFQNVASMDPMWSADGQTVYFNSDADGTFDVYSMPLSGGDTTRVTDVGAADGSDDGVAFPTLARNGGKLLVRRLFDLQAIDLKTGEGSPIELFAAGDGVVSPMERRSLNKADRVAFTPDGKQMAFVSGQDLWVMDRILKEPVRVTRTANDETWPVFSADGSTLYFVTDSGGEADIWAASHDQEDGIWWMAEDFKLAQITDDRAVESDLQLSPDGSHIGYIKGTDIFVMDDDGTDHRRVAQMWSSPDYAWSPDGRWITYVTQDDDYNPDVFIVPLDGTREPFNLSRHPDWDSSPSWSGDGKRIAWVGRRDGEEADIYYVELTKASSEATSRDETLEKALKAMEPKGGKSKKSEAKPDAADKSAADRSAADKETADEVADESATEKPDEDLVQIDFDGLLDRVQRYRISGSTESNLIWGKGGDTLCFSGTVDGKRGFYAVEFPNPKDPKRIASVPLATDRWIEDSKEFVGLTMGVPTSMKASGETEGFTFSVRTTGDWREVRQIAFDQAWRAMRDRFYDEDYNNRDWYAIRAKYRPVAAECLGAAEFSHLCNMMLGELNASHMGHRGGSDPLPSFDAQNEWSPTTYQLGLRYVLGADGPGMTVESVIPGSPCSLARSEVKAGEALVAIDGEAVGPEANLDAMLTLEQVRDVVLTIRSKGGEEREVTVRPASSVTGLLYDEWVENTRAKVDELSEGKLGYLHIKGMNFTSFRQMEEDLYHAGVGKEGMIIDVRFNGGGSTTDHVLTALTQPVHAITQSRGSGEGYPQDRKVYASWSKPIVVMCNEHSFSNAEILSHAIKHLGRGRLVGMRTAGGVISTGGQSLLDGSFIRMPTRGWYLAGTGEDMELNGCEPDIAFWNDPAWASASGTDAQLVRAVEVLGEDVAAEKAKPRVKLVPAARLRR